MEVITKDIKYGSGSEHISAYHVSPAAPGKYPGIILIHEIFGLDDHIRGVARRIAAEGYIVLAPHLFSSESLSSTLNSENISETMRFMFSIPPEKQRDPSYRDEQIKKLDSQKRDVIESVNRVLFVDRPIEKFVSYMSSGVDYLRNEQNCDGKIGSVGFCFGGGMSINLACTSKTDASVIFYGENPKPISKVSGVKGSVMGIYGGEDARINSGIGELSSELVKNKIPFTIRVFPGVFHAFFNDSHRQTYNKRAAEEAWKMLLEFYRENLKGGLTNP